MDAEASGRLRAAYDFDPATHIPLMCQGTRIGWLCESRAERLMAWRDVFMRDAAGVHISETYDTPDRRTAAAGRVIRALYQEGAITGWRDERYAVVTDFDAPALFHIERAAARYFGTTTYAAHANGYCGAGVDCEMWLARRSAAKPIDPGMLDNLVGGGMSAGVPPLQALIREAREEAGIPAGLARNAVAAGTVRLLRDVPEGVQSELIFVYDLELPRDFEPRNEDGEVAEFRRVPITDIVRILSTESDIALEAALIMMSYLERRCAFSNAAQ